MGAVLPARLQQNRSIVPISEICKSKHQPNAFVHAGEYFSYILEMFLNT